MLPRRAFLGAELAGDAEAFGATGVRIAGVLAGGMAERAGLVAGDVVAALAGAPVRDPCELGVALRLAGALREVELVVERDRERFERSVAVVALPFEVDAEHGELAVGDVRLRVIATRAASPKTLVLVIQGIACESIDCATTPEAPLAALIEGWTRGGHDTLRFDKRGVGDSEGGPCKTTDFATELADARAVCDYAAAEAAKRGIPLVVFGHSVGGIIAAQLTARDGVIVYGTPVMRWLDCLVDSTRRQLKLHGAPLDQIERAIDSIRNLAQNGDLNGRSAAYHEQLHALDLEAAWRGITVPVLVVRGEYDWVVDAADQARIATLAANVQVVDVAGLDHLFGHHADHAGSLRDYGDGAADRSLFEATLPWLDAIRLRA